MKIRQPAVANMFYPGNPAMLKQSILQYLGAVEYGEEAAGAGARGVEPQGEGLVRDGLQGAGLTAALVREKVRAGKLKGLIVPHAGYIYSGPVAAYAHKLLKDLPKNREWKIVLIGVSHGVPFSGAAVAENGVWKTPLGDARVFDIRDELGVAHDDEEIFLSIPQAHEDEHSLEVQIPFLQIVLNGNFVLYPVATGAVRPDFLAGKLENFVRRDDVIIIVSSDLSHYLPYDEAVKIDRETLGNIVAMKTDDVIERGDACGLKGILTMMFLAEKFGWKPALLDYRNSGDTAGDKNKVVGYGSVAFTE
jgi:AmmeMemoRadiSam system protein B